MPSNAPVGAGADTVRPTPTKLPSGSCPNRHPRRSTSEAASRYRNGPWAYSPAASGNGSAGPSPRPTSTSHTPSGAAGAGAPRTVSARWLPVAPTGPAARDLHSGDVPAYPEQLLDEHPDPDDEQIKHYLSGNLCRCATYPEVMDAVKLAAKKRKGAAAG